VVGSVDLRDAIVMLFLASSFLLRIPPYSREYSKEIIYNCQTEISDQLNLSIVGWLVGLLRGMV
jgi:hypothetical protein